MLPVIYYTPAKKYFKKLNDKVLKSKFEEAIKEIRTDPKSGTRKTGDLADIWGYDIYHNKINYEIAYTTEVLDDNKVIIIIMAGTRENFWDEVKRYLN